MGFVAGHLLSESKLRRHFCFSSENLNKATWKVLSYTDLKNPAKTSPLRNGWSKIWNHPLCMSLHCVPIMPKSPPHCFYGEDERKRLANDLNFCLTKTHPSKIWSGYMSTIRSINETWNSWRLRSEPALCQANTHQIMALIFLFIHEVSKMLRMTQKLLWCRRWSYFAPSFPKKMLSVSSLGGSQHDSFFEG